MMRGTEHLGQHYAAEDEKRPDEEEEEEEVMEYIPSPYPDSQCSRTFPVHPKYSSRRISSSSSLRRERQSSGKLAGSSLSLRSPISILATPPPPSSAHQHQHPHHLPTATSSGPHSAPATFSSWGKQSPIPRLPHHSSSFHSPLLLSSSSCTPSPSSSSSSSYLLSPGRDASSSFSSCSPQLTSSPLLLTSSATALESKQHTTTTTPAGCYLDASFSDSVMTSSPPPAATAAASAAAAAMLNLVRPDIPVGIAVARQRQTDQAAAAAAAAASLLTVKDPAAGTPLPWTPAPYHHPYSLFSHHHPGVSAAAAATGAAAAAPLLPPLSLTDYHPGLGGTRGDHTTAPGPHGGYLGPGSAAAAAAAAAYWSPYSYPLLLPHYQHYHNQLLLLHQAALVTQQQQQQQQANRQQVPVYGPPPGHLSQEPAPAAYLLGPYDPYRAVCPPAPLPPSSAFTSLATSKGQESKTKDDSGLETSENLSHQEEATDLSRTEPVATGSKQELLVSLEEDNISVGTDPEPAPLLFPRQSEESVIEIPGGVAPIEQQQTAESSSPAAAGDSDAVMAVAEQPATELPAAGEDDNGGGERQEEDSSPKPLLNGLELLTEGIARLEKYEQTHPRTGHEKRVSGSRLLTRHASMDSSVYPLKGLGLLCDVATQKIREELQLLQPATPRTIRSKSVELERTADRKQQQQPDLNRNYHVATSRDEIREFIRRRASRSSECSSASGGGGNFPGSSPGKAGSFSPCRGSPAKVAVVGSSPAKDLDEMDAWEISMRLDMADIQRKYRQKYQELYRLESRKDKQRLKKRQKSRKKSHSGPESTPKKPKKIYTTGHHHNNHRSPAAAAAASSHRFSIPSIRVDPPPPVKTATAKRPDDDSDEEEADSDSEPEEERRANNSSSSSNFQETFAKFRQSYLSSASAKPKASGLPVIGSGSQPVFKSHKPSPFQNLMKLSGRPVIKHEPVQETVVFSQPEMPKIKQEPGIDSAAVPLADFSSTTATKRKSEETSGGESPGKKKPKMEKFIVANSTHQHDRHAQQQDDGGSGLGDAQRHLTEAIGSGTKKKKKKERKEKDDDDHRRQQRDEKTKKKDRHEDLSLIVKREVEDEEEEEENENEKKRRKERKKRKRKEKKRVVRVTGLEEDQVTEIMDRTPTPSSSGHLRIKQEIVRESEDEEVEETEQRDLAISCVLGERNLRDGQRILFRIGSHFHPGRITEISPPDIYGILVDRERGNKPHIYSREEVLTQAILEVRPPSLGWLVPGMRVCAYWSTKYHYLHPGTIVPNTQGLHLPAGYVVIELDDGDSRDFHIDSIRILPPDYPIVASEPDPMAVLSALKRRRTVSTESRHLAAASIKREPIEQDEEESEYPHNSNGHDGSAAFSAASRVSADDVAPTPTKKTTKPYKPKKKDHHHHRRHRRRKDGGEAPATVTSGAAATVAVSNMTAAVASTSSGSSSKAWCSEVTPDLKIRIRSPDSRPVTAASAAGAATIPAEISPLTTSTPPLPLDRLAPPPLSHEWSTNGGGRSVEEKRRRRHNTDYTAEEEEDEEDSAFESNGKFDEDDDIEEDDEAVTDLMAGMRKRFPSEDKSKIRAFLPPHHLLWTWGDVGTKPRNKTRKIFHQEIVRGKGRDERLTLGDSAVFLSTSRPDRPYIGRIESMWESWSGNMKVRVRWFYHSEETEGTGEGGRRIQDLTEPGALFESCHFDENDIQTISHKCDVLEFAEFQNRIRKDPNLKMGIYDNNDLYYLAGSYDPVVGTLSFRPGVFP